MWHERVEKEKSELYAKIITLERLLDSPKPVYISPEQWQLLKEQIYYMRQYHEVLARRIQDV
ncbi:hypothetical protein ACFBZI_08625 [Moraxella sp. ZJ142]|uniref:crAss001_48 related protein n=1 Tax=Moraxella marmotae TaxID=3344520 RepID=UPI0035D44B44